MKKKMKELTIDRIRSRLSKIVNSLEKIKAGGYGYTKRQVRRVEALDAEFKILSEQLTIVETDWLAMGEHRSPLLLLRRDP